MIFGAETNARAIIRELSLRNLSLSRPDEKQHILIGQVMDVLNTSRTVVDRDKLHLHSMNYRHEQITLQVDFIVIHEKLLHFPKATHRSECTQRDKRRHQRVDTCAEGKEKLT